MKSCAKLAGYLLPRKKVSELLKKSFTQSRGDTEKNKRRKLLNGKPKATDLFSLIL